MSRLDIKAKLVNGAAVVYPGPYLNQLRGEEIERRCRELLAQGVRDIAINFGETELVNSIGVSLLLGVIEAVSEAGGTLVLSNLSVSTRELFEVLGLLSYVKVEETEEGALEWLSGHAEIAARR